MNKAAYNRIMQLGSARAVKVAEQILMNMTKPAYQANTCNHIHYSILHDEKMKCPRKTNWRKDA